MKSTRIVLSFAVAAGALSFAIATPARAADVRHGNTVVIGPGEVVEDDLYAFGNSVEVRGTVHGDVIAFARTVDVSGKVDGDVFAGAETVRVSGTIGGSARAAGQRVTIDGPVARDALIAAQDATLASQGHVTRDALVAGETIRLNGPVDGSVQAAGSTIEVASAIGGNLRARTQTLRLQDGANVTGAVRYDGAKDAEIAPGAKVGGAIERIPLPPPARPNPLLAVVGWLRMLAGLFALGLVLVLVYPSFARRSAASLGETPWGSLGFGIAMLVGIPVLAAIVFMLGLLVGGWWLAVAGLALYLLAIAATFPVVGFTLGRWVLSKLGDRFEHRVGALLVGLALILLVTAVPILGLLVALVVICLGLGAMLQAALPGRRRVALPPVSATPA